MSLRDIEPEGLDEALGGGSPAVTPMEEATGSDGEEASLDGVGKPGEADGESGAGSADEEFETVSWGDLDGVRVHKEDKQKIEKHLNRIFTQKSQVISSKKRELEEKILKEKAEAERALAKAREIQENVQAVFEANPDLESKYQEVDFTKNLRNKVTELEGKLSALTGELSASKAERFIESQLETAAKKFVLPEDSDLTPEMVKKQVLAIASLSGDPDFDFVEKYGEVVKPILSRHAEKKKAYLASKNKQSSSPNVPAATAKTSDSPRTRSIPEITDWLKKQLIGK